MQITVKHYVEFFYPGAFLAESSAKEVPARDHLAVEIPEGAYGFRFFDRAEGATELLGEKPVSLTSERINESAMFYPGGRALTLKDVRRELPNERILIANMEGNGYKAVVRTRRGWMQPLREGDVVF